MTTSWKGRPWLTCLFSKIFSVWLPARVYGNGSFLSLLNWTPRLGEWPSHQLNIIWACTKNNYGPLLKTCKLTWNNALSELQIKWTIWNVECLVQHKMSLARKASSICMLEIFRVGNFRLQVEDTFCLRQSTLACFEFHSSLGSLSLIFLLVLTATSKSTNNTLVHWTKCPHQYKVTSAATEWSFWILAPKHFGKWASLQLNV